MTFNNNRSIPEGLNKLQNLRTLILQNNDLQVSLHIPLKIIL